jgi:hypothetical protein
VFHSTLIKNLHLKGNIIILMHCQVCFHCCIFAKCHLSTCFIRLHILLNVGHHLKQTKMIKYLGKHVDSKVQSKKEHNTRIESKGRVFRPHGALMVLPCMGSLTQVTIWPAPRTARIRCGSLTLMFSAPILAMMVILPGLFWGFSISISFTSSFGSILSLTCISHIKIQLFNNGSSYSV